MPMKLITLACGLVCGVGLAIVVQAAGSRGEDDRGLDRREIREDRRASASASRRERDDDFDRDDELSDRRKAIERGDRRRQRQAFNDDRIERRDERWELAARDERDRSRRGEEGRRAEFNGPRRGRETAEQSPRSAARQSDGPRGPEVRRPGIAHTRGQREWEERAPRGRREFANREPNWRPEEHRRPERGGERFADHQPRGAAFRHQDRGAAMGADIVEAADLAVFATDENQRLAEIVPADVVARIGNFIAMDSIDPALAPDMLHLKREEGGVGVTARRDQGHFGEALGRLGAVGLIGLAGNVPLPFVHVHGGNPLTN